MVLQFHFLMHNSNLSTDPMAAKYCQVNIKTPWLSSLVTSWFYLFLVGRSFPTAQKQQSYQAICPHIYTVSILPLLMPLFSIHHALWNEILQAFKAHSKVQDALSLPPGLVSLFPLLPEKNHFLPCNGCFTPLTYISVLCQSCPKLFLFILHLSS